MDIRTYDEESFSEVIFLIIFLVSIIMKMLSSKQQTERNKFNYRILFYYFMAFWMRNSKTLIEKSRRIMILLHHIAIATVDYDQYKMLFEKIGMHLERETGIMPYRQLWFREGIQLKESRNVKKGSNVDHIALKTDCKEEILQIALQNGCTADEHGDSWFSLSNGTSIELIETIGT